MPSSPEETPITAAEASAHPGLAAWRVLRRHLHTTLRTGSMPVGADLVSRIVAAAERLNHHPDLDLRYASLHVRITTHSAGGLTRADTALAEEVTRIARELGVPADPAAPQALEIGIDTLDSEQIRHFWRAVLGYTDDGDELADPHGAGPQVWFQAMSEPRPQRNRVHLDIYLPHDQVDARLTAALAAGGRLVDESHAPSWWVLADAEGNEACLCTWQGAQHSPDRERETP